MYEFIDFLDCNSLYAKMIIKKEKWEAIIIEYECIDAKRRDVVEAWKIIASRWKQKLLNLWILEKNFLLYLIKREVMIKMHVIINRIENEHLMKSMMKQVIYHWAAQAIISREWISVSSFSQSLNYKKLITEQKKLMLIEEQLNRMSWMRIEPKLLKEWSRNMNLKLNHVETVINSSAVLQFMFERKLRTSKHKNYSFVTETNDVIMISDFNSSKSVMQSLIIRFCQSSRIITLISFNMIALFTSLNSSRTSHVYLFISFHFLILIASALSELAEYDEQKLALSLNVIMNNEKILLQYSLESEMSDAANVCEKAIIATVIKSIWLKVQQSCYQIIKNFWEMRESKACSCIWMFYTWKQRLNYLDSMSLTMIMKLLREFHFNTKDVETFICHSHLQKLRNRLKLLMNELSFKILIDYINIIYDYKFQLNFVKIDVTFTDWFRWDSYFFRFTDSLQLFQLQSYILQNYKIDTSLIYNMFIKKIKYQKWKKNNAIMLLNVFD